MSKTKQERFNKFVIDSRTEFDKRFENLNVTGDSLESIISPVITDLATIPTSSNIPVDLIDGMYNPISHKKQKFGVAPLKLNSMKNYYKNPYEFDQTPPLTVHDRAAKAYFKEEARIAYEAEINKNINNVLGKSPDSEEKNLKYSQKTAPNTSAVKADFVSLPPSRTILSPEEKIGKDRFNENRNIIGNVLSQKPVSPTSPVSIADSGIGSSIMVPPSKVPNVSPEVASEILRQRAQTAKDLADAVKISKQNPAKLPKGRR